MVHRPCQGTKTCAIGVHVVIHGRREVGAAVITMVKDSYLATAGEFAGNLHGIFHRLSTGVNQD